MTIGTQPLEEIPGDIAPLQLSRVKDSFHKFPTLLDGHDNILKLITPYLQLRFLWTTNAVGVFDDGQGGECAVSTNFQILFYIGFLRKHSLLYKQNGDPELFI